MDEAGPGRGQQTVVLATLFLRGLGQSIPAPRASWPTMWSLVQEHGTDRQTLIDVLQSLNFSEEVSCLSNDQRYSSAIEALEEGRLLSVADATYPTRWLRALGSHAPPVLWRKGRLQAAQMVAVVGSRTPTPQGKKLAISAGKLIAQRSAMVVSGGAIGIDQAAVSGALEVQDDPTLAALEIYPYGLERSLERPTAGLSLSAPFGDFSTAGAMERNILIYAAATHTLVIEPRFRQGGTWHGAVEALRRKLTHVIVFSKGDKSAVRTLVALGASPMAKLDELPGLLELPAPVCQPELFGAQDVRELFAQFA